jgi:hypothetical protein
MGLSRVTGTSFHFLFDEENRHLTLIGEKNGNCFSPLVICWMDSG